MINDSSDFVHFFIEIFQKSYFCMHRKGTAINRFLFLSNLYFSSISACLFVTNLVNMLFILVNVLPRSTTVILHLRKRNSETDLNGFLMRPCALSSKRSVKIYTSCIVFNQDNLTITDGARNLKVGNTTLLLCMVMYLITLLRAAQNSDIL